MNCPTCQVELKMADRQGIEIDYCPKCRGVWLDRGELDKLIERALGMTGARDAHYDDDHHDDDHRGDDARGGDRNGNQPRRRRREGVLGEIFDIFG